jgi:hypothetical protein
MQVSCGQNPIVEGLKLNLPYRNTSKQTPFSNKLLSQNSLSRTYNVKTVNRNGHPIPGLPKCKWDNASSTSVLSYSSNKWFWDIMLIRKQLISLKLQMDSISNTRESHMPILYSTLLSQTSLLNPGTQVNWSLMILVLTQLCRSILQSVSLLQFAEMTSLFCQSNLANHLVESALSYSCTR